MFSYDVPTASRELAIALLLSLTVAIGGCASGATGGDQPQSAPDTSPDPVSPTPSPPTPAPTPVPPSVNTAPSIAGQPARSIVVGRAYSFTPAAADAEGNSLTFSVNGKPDWASFDTRTGRLAGTPDRGDVGSYTVTIRVSDGAKDASLAFSVQVLAMADGRATLSWEAPTERSDGSRLTDLAGYRIYYGNSQNDLAHRIVVTNSTVTTWVVENLSAGKWYFVATSVDSKGVESERSNMAAKTIA